MSAKHPVVAVTGSSGAGTTYVRNAFMNIFRRESIKAAIIGGDCFHNVTRQEFQEAVSKAASEALKPLMSYSNSDHRTPKRPS